MDKKTSNQAERDPAGAENLINHFLRFVTQEDEIDIEDKKNSGESPEKKENSEEKTHE